MKKLLALLLALAMLTALMAGCGSSSSDSAESTAASEETAEISEEPEEPASVEEEAPEEEPEAPVEEPAEEPEPPEEEPAEPPEEDEEEEIPEEPVFEGVDYDLPLFDETLDLSIFAPLRGSFPSKTESGIYLFWDRFQENLNVNIKFVEPAQSAAEDQFNLVIASGDMPDIFFESMVTMSGAAYAGGYDKGVEDEVYIDLTDYVEEYCPNYYALINSDEEAHRASYTDEGRVVSFFTIYTEDQTNNMGLCVNSAYLEATGFDVPETIDEWDKVFAAMKSNGVQHTAYTNGDGELLNGSVEDALGADVACEFVMDAETGELVFAPTTEETKAYIELFRDWFQAGYIDPDFITINAMDNTPFNNGTLATFSTMSQEVETYADNYGISITPCPTIHPEGAGQGEILLGSLSSTRVSDLPGITVSTSCKNVEDVLKIMDWMYSPNGSLICNYGWVEGELYDMVDGSPKINDNYSSRDPETNIAMRSLYTSDGDFGYVEPNISLQQADDFMVTMVTETWYTDSSYPIAIYYTLPGTVALTAAESDAIGNTFADIDTYVDGTILQWLSCSADFNDDVWNDFIATVESMGLENVREIYTAAFTRYLEK